MRSLCVAGALLLSGCAPGIAQGPGPAPAPASPSSTWSFVRQVDGVPVADTAGRLLPHPFLGGFDVPRPQLVDIDGDGDLDLFLQERSGAVMHFERDGARWRWRTDQFGGFDVGEWFRFVDLDRDGDVDLLGERRNGYIQVWRNDGDAKAPRFVALPDSLRDASGRAMFADPQNILAAADIDCNNLLDLFVGRVSGTIDRYEEVGRGPDGIPRFRMQAERWQGIEIIGTAQVGGPGNRPSMHGANTMAFADVDRDGDLDLYWGDFFEPGLLRIENRGTCANPDLQGAPAQFPGNDALLTSGYNAPTWGDTDGDGDLDLVMGVIGGAFQPSRTSIDNLYHVEQVGPNRFELRTGRLISTVDVGSEAAPTLADIDGDGDLDLVVGNKIATESSEGGVIVVFENVGTRQAPSFRERRALPGPFEFHPTPTFVDLDGDGTKDLVTGTWRDRVKWYRGTPGGFVLADSALVTITRGSNAAPALADLDGDGDLDLVVGEGSGEVNLYRNVGTRTAPRFELVSDQFQQMDVGRRSAPALADMNGDGKPDLLLGAEGGGVQLWINVTTGAEIRFERDTGFVIDTYHLSVPTVGDVDGDGDLDLVVGIGSGGIQYFENQAVTRPKQG